MYALLKRSHDLLVEIACQPDCRARSPAYFGGYLVSVVENVIEAYGIEILGLIMGSMLLLNDIC